MEYRVVQGIGDSVEFEEEVNALLRLGWEPQGGVSVAIYDDNEKVHRLFFQALIKR